MDKIFIKTEELKLDIYKILTNKVAPKARQKPRLVLNFEQAYHIELVSSKIYQNFENGENNI